MEDKKRVVVTGSNKGIGYAIVERIAKEHPSYEIVMAVRTVSNGEEALKKLAGSIPDIDKRVKVEELDVSNFDSIHKFVSKIGPIDILINNAGIAAKGDNFDAKIVQDTFQTNFYGTIELSEKMIQNINTNGKIITVGSSAGKLEKIKDDKLKASFEDPKITRSQIFDLAKLYYDSVVDDTFEKKGFPKQGYAMSKLCINTYTRVLGQQKEVLDKNIQVYVFCPGWCRTDMAGDKAPKSAEDGADTCAYLVDLPWEINNDFQGKFFYERQVKPL